MKKVIMAMLTVVLIACGTSCKNEGDVIVKGKCTPESAVIYMEAYAEKAPVMDQYVAMLAQLMKLDIKTLSQMNQMVSALSTQLLTANVSSIEFISETELSITLTNGTIATGAYNLKDGTIMMTIPAELTGLPIPLPIQLGCTKKDNGVSFFIDKTTIDAFISSSAFDIIMNLLKDKLGGVVTADMVRTILGMIQTVEISANFKAN